VSEYLKSPTWVIIGLNLLAFVAVALKSHAVVNFNSDVLMRFGANFGVYSLTTQPWRLLTATFLHGGLFHFLFNMWALLNLGILAELIFGAWPFLGLYICAGLGGSIASSWWHTNTVGVGASGAIFGIAGALLPALALHPNPRLRAALRGSLTSIGFFVVYNLIYGAAAKQTDNAAHLGGLVVGLALGFALPTGRDSRDNTRRFAAIVGAVLVLALGFAFARQQRRAVIEFQRAFDYFERHDLPHAAEYAQRSIEHDPKFVSSQFLLGNIYLQQGDNLRAEELLRRTVAIKPDFAPGYAQLCAATLRLEKLGDALAACRRAAELAPNDADNQFNLGLTLRAAEDYAASAKAFGRAVALRPNGAEENYYYGLSLMQSGEPHKAIAVLTRAQQLKPDDKAIAVALGRATAWSQSK
jgi:membrane associated rhomboid family serine protease/Flp pilus assembly protein TadD